MSSPAHRSFAPIDFKTRFPALDGIRALAVTLVFVAHLSGGAHGGPVLRLFNRVREQGVIGVDIFFVLSGFLITGILFDTTRDSHYLKRFFARRSLRIFPIVYLLFFILLLLTPLLRYQWHAGHLLFLVYFGNLLGNYNFNYYVVDSARYPDLGQAIISHLWSLCVEEQFYLLWPFVVLFVRDRVRLLYVCYGIALLTLGLRVAFFLHVGPSLGERWIVRTLVFRMDSLVLGAALALLLRGENADRIQRGCKWLFFGALLPLLAMLYLYPAHDSFAQCTYGLTLTSLMSMGLIGATLRTGSAAFRLFHLGPLRTIGKYSYGFYVYHLVWAKAWFVLLTYLKVHLHSLALAGVIELSVAYVATFLVAKISYDYFEVRFLKYKRYFEYDSELRTHRTAFAVDGR